jgi:hypothetical protein
MPQVSSRLSIAGSDDPVIHPAFIARMAGIVIQLTRAAFDIAITAERTRIDTNGAGIYADNQRFLINGEVGQRLWTINGISSHANKVEIRSGLILTLADIANTCTATTGIPTGGTLGDIAVDYADNSYYNRGVSAWVKSSVPIFPGTGGSTAVTFYDPPTDNPSNITVTFVRASTIIAQTIPVTRIFAAGTYQYTIKLNSVGEVLEITPWALV